jgi:hypothetical protein
MILRSSILALRQRGQCFAGSREKYCANSKGGVRPLPDFQTLGVPLPEKRTNRRNQASDARRSGSPPPVGGIALRHNIVDASRLGTGQGGRNCARESCGVMHRLNRCVAQLTQAGLNEALGGLGADVLEPAPMASPAKSERFVAGTIVGHHLLHFDTEAVVLGHCLLQ